MNADKPSKLPKDLLQARNRFQTWRSQRPNDKGDLTKGQKSTADSETLWRFQPDGNWASGNYPLRVGLPLEDLAGNRPDRAFDAPTRQSGKIVEAILNLDCRVK